MATTTQQTAFSNILRYCLLLTSIVALFWITCTSFVTAADDTTTTTNSSEEENSKPPRLITPDELKLANGKDSDNLWLAVAGQVYDVRKGENYYGPGESYHIFTGKDALVPYSTGIFNEEEAAKSWKDLEPKTKLTELGHWVEFYRKDERYPLVGHLIGNFYDERGHPTAESVDFYRQMEEQKVLKKQQQEERKRQAKETAAKRKAAQILAKEKEPQSDNDNNNDGKKEL
mmetsp:Transcript_20768/g.44973  ORF Transcript_20768/g.44973 Transcript_20768/m.44973 type:complete len:230 (+) Transcript_20768:185-874(+)